MFDWLHKINVRVYLCQAMTGIRQNVIYQRNAYCTRVLEKYGIEVWSPVTEEGVSPSNKKLDQPSQEQLRKFWRRDKFLIKHCHVLLDITGPSRSQGSLHEIGLARYFIFQPVVRVMKLSGPSVVIEEEDLIAPTVEKAAQLITQEFGTPWKRLKWKFKLFGRCFPGYIRTRIMWWMDWI